jgi:hypothetical protein
MKRPILPRLQCCAAALTVLLCVWSLTFARAQEEGPVTSKGENFSAKPPAALFNSDCTGAGCHKGPQGLGKGQSQSGLAGFLREHYTNSRESAAALAGYLLKLPAGPEPREQREARPTRPGRGEPSLGETFFGTRREAKPEPKPESKPAETRTSRQHPTSRTSRAAAKPEDKPEEAAPAAAEPKEAAPKEKEKEAAPKEKEAAPKEKETPVRQASPKPTRAQRGKAAAVAPPPPPEPPPAPAPPPKKEYDIFD